MGSSSVWGNIQGFTVTEYVRSRDSGIFRRWWVKVMSPYKSHLCGSQPNAKGEGNNKPVKAKRARAQVVGLGNIIHQHVSGVSRGRFNVDLAFGYFFYPGS